MRASDELAELKEYLGDAYDDDLLRGHVRALEAELARAGGDEATLYRTSQVYLYDLTVFAMSATKAPYLAALREAVPPGARLLDYGCGIGSDGLALLEAGYDVTFADFDNPSTAYLRWRLERRGLTATVHDLDPGPPPGAPFDLAYAFDVLEHVPRPFLTLAALERLAGRVLVNVLEPQPGETSLHQPLPVEALRAHARAQDLERSEVHHGRSHLLLYRPRRPELSVVIPTLGRRPTLARVLDRLAAQRGVPPGAFETVVALDAAAPALPEGAVRGARPGASSARNAGWRAARAPVVLFLDDDVLPDLGLVARHLAAHAERPAVEDAVLGDVRWAAELRVTPFMRWLERGLQFDFGSIVGEDAGPTRLYTANASVKRALLERVGGFDEERLPFGYEDLDLGLRLAAHGLRLRYDRAASAEHLHAMTLEEWEGTVRRIARAERAFVVKHPQMAPHFRDRLTAYDGWPPLRGRAARLARFVPERTPVLGPYVWSRAAAYWSQRLARPFMEAWGP